eukprot:scaffold14236_cov63-Phaeocystis_antarctica.AAC.3
MAQAPAAAAALSREAPPEQHGPAFRAHAMARAVHWCGPAVRQRAKLWFIVERILPGRVRPSDVLITLQP